MPKKKTRARARPHALDCGCKACVPQSPHPRDCDCRKCCRSDYLDSLPPDSTALYPAGKIAAHYFPGATALRIGAPRVAGPLGRANDLPIPVHGDSLRDELGDLLSMLSHLQDLIPQRRPEAALQQAADCYALLRSILGHETN